MTAPVSGEFIQDVLSGSNITRTVYHNRLNWGLKYLNSNGLVNTTYTIQIYLRVVNFNSFYTRILDLSNGIEDNGIYFTNVNTPPPATSRCLNFYPYGNFGVCPFFDDHTYYLLTFTRSNITKLIDIYVNDQLFTSYNDAANFYVSTANKPVYIFRDDPVGFACEDGEANFAYLSFANYYSTQSEVASVYQDLNAFGNTADFSITPPNVCTGNPTTIIYTGNIPASAAQYNYTWNWNGGNVISGSGQGPFVVTWNSSGAKTIALNISGNDCGSVISNSKQIIIDSANRITFDTSICAGNSFNGHSNSGTYLDTIANGSACAVIRTTNLHVLGTPVPDLGSTTTLCIGDSIRLSPGVFDSYLWQDGSTQSSYTVSKAGLYSVTVSTKCGNASTQVQVTEMRCSLYFPNAFTPNKDGKNESFKILTNFIFAEYNLAIYNRYGQKVFESSLSDRGWDGTYKNVNVETGTYVWVCSFRKSSSAQAELLRGTLVLVR